jgi:hypothetical protein
MPLAWCCPMAVLGRAAEIAMITCRPERAHGAHHVAEHLVRAAVGNASSADFEKPRRRPARKKLAAAVEAPRSEQLLGADRAERLAPARCR